MSNNPMKRPVEGRKLRSLKVAHMTPFGTVDVPMRKGMDNWRKKAGQYA